MKKTSRVAYNLWRRVQSWLTIFELSVQERLVYRGEFFLGALMRFLPIVTQILLWAAIFEAVGGVTQARIVGYSYRQMVAYYLLTMISRAFSSMPSLASGIARDIRDGNVKKFLVQPVDLLGFLLLHRVAHKVVYYVMALGPFFVIFYLCRGFFEGWPDGSVISAYILSLLLAFLLGFYLEATIGLVGFWFLEVSSLVFVFMLLNFFFSGHMFPLDMLPEPFRSLVALLPFQYLAYYPSAIFLGKVPAETVWLGVGVQGLWTLAAFVTARVVLYLGVRRYSGFGG